MYGNIVNHDLHWIAGDSVNAVITYKVDGQVQDLTGCSVRMVVRQQEGESGVDVGDSLVATYTSLENHFLIPVPADGKVYFNLASDITKTLNPENELKVQYVYSLQLVKPGDGTIVELVRTLLRGKLTIHSGVAR